MGTRVACFECTALLNECFARQQEYTKSVGFYLEAVMGNDDPSIEQAACLRMTEARDFAEGCELLYSAHQKEDHGGSVSLDAPSKLVA